VIQVTGQLVAQRCARCNRQITPNSGDDAIQFAIEHRFHNGYQLLVSLDNKVLAGTPIEVHEGRRS
jgi:hypothetical protein